MLAADDRLRGALEVAYRYLNRRERTVGEVREQLERRGTEMATIDRAIAALCDQGYLDDIRFARLFVEDKRRLEQWGSERIGKALLARGVDGELMRAALGEDAREDELSRARAVLRRRFPSMSGDRGERERMLAVLLRKGYESELALEAVRLHLAGAEHS